MERPSGKAIATPTAKPATTRPKETKRLRVRARSNQSDGNDRATSSGLGRMVGEMNRASGVAPAVTSHQRARTPAMGTTPSAQLIHVGTSSRIPSQARYRPAAGPGAAGTAPPSPAARCGSAGSASPGAVRGSLIPVVATSPRAGRPRSRPAG